MKHIRCEIIFASALITFYVKIANFLDKLKTNYSSSARVRIENVNLEQQPQKKSHGYKYGDKYLISIVFTGNMNTEYMIIHKQFKSQGIVHCS